MKNQGTNKNRKAGLKCQPAKEPLGTRNYRMENSRHVASSLFLRAASVPPPPTPRAATPPGQSPHAVRGGLGAVVPVQHVEDVVLGAAAQHGLVQRAGQVFRVPDHDV